MLKGRLTRFPLIGAIKEIPLYFGYDVVLKADNEIGTPEADNNSLVYGISTNANDEVTGVIVELFDPIKYSKSVNTDLFADNQKP